MSLVIFSDEPSSSLFGHLLVPIEAAAQLLDLLLVDVEPDGARELARERQRHGQTDVSETNHCDPLQRQTANSCARQVPSARSMTRGVLNRIDSSSGRKVRRSSVEAL